MGKREGVYVALHSKNPKLLLRKQQKQKQHSLSSVEFLKVQIKFSIQDGGGSFHFNTNSKTCLKC
jgi:hypothetical protein